MLDFLTLKVDSFGLDISDLRLRVAKLKWRNKKTECSSVGILDLNPGLVQMGEVKDEKGLSEAIKLCVKKNRGEKIKTKYVVASLPDDRAFVQVVQTPKLSNKEIQAAVIYQAENYIPLPINEVYLDYQIIREPFLELDHYDVLIVALPKKAVDPYVNAIKSAGLKILALELESQAIIRYLLKNGFCSSPVIIVQVGDIKTNLIIYAGYSLRYVFSAPLSNEYFVKNISRVLGLDQYEAEEFKSRHGIEKFSDLEKDDDKGKSAIRQEELKQKKVFEALIPGLTDFIQQLKRYLNYYHTHASHEHLGEDKRKIDKMILCGSGSDLKGLGEFISLKTGLSVSGLESGAFDFKQEKKPLLSKKYGYETVFGLAARGFQGAFEKQNEKVQKAEYKKKAKKIGKNDQLTSAPTKKRA